MFELHFWGANSHGQSGSEESEEQFETPIIVNFPDPETIVQICGGGGHTIILTNEDKAYVAGWNNKGQCSDISQDSSLFEPILVNFSIQSVRCGWDITALISDSNELFVLGNNQYEQFGQKEPKFSRSPLKVNVPEGIEISDVSFGLRHTSILSTSGKVLLCGQSRCLKVAEEMRHDDILKIHKFQHNNISYLEMQFASPISLISSGQHFTVAYTEADNRLYLIGENKHASLSNQEIDIAPITMIKEISAGWTHVAILDEFGAVYTVGRNNYYQLGRKSAVDPSSIFKVFAIRHVKTVSCGSEHTAVLTEKGEVLTWGWNEHGNCGVGGVENVATPTKVKLPGKCLMIGTGCGFCFAVTKR